MKYEFLIKYKSFASVEEKNEAVKNHINVHYDELTQSAKEVLDFLSQNSCKIPGVSYLLGKTVCEKLGISERTFYRCTKSLSDLGIITKYKTTNRKGQGATIYVIAPKIKKSCGSHHMANTSHTPETHVSLTAPTDSHVISNADNLLRSYSLNNFVSNNVVNNVIAPASQDMKSILQEIYLSKFVDGYQAFQELCKIAFGRLKQYMKSHNIPYLQMTEIVINCMRQLVAKENVRNQFALYSSMIKRQVEQLFEAHIKPTTSLIEKSKEMVPEWMKEREVPSKTSTVNAGMDFEAERAKILAKLQGAV